MSEKKAKKEAFARAYAGDPQASTFQNATQSYLAVNPDASVEAARRGSVRMMKDAYVQEMLAELRKAQKAFGALTLEEFIRKGMQMVDKAVKLAEENPESSNMTAAARILDTLGKASGFYVKKIEDVTPAERKFPPQMTPEQLSVARRAVEQLERLNQPNPMPQRIRATATIVEEEDGRVDDDSSPQ